MVELKMHSTPPIFKRPTLSPQLDHIWQQIQCLDEADRLVLEQRLHELAESQWREEVNAARELARQRGIDQASIDDAVEQVRYGS